MASLVKSTKHLQKNQGQFFSSSLKKFKRTLPNPTYDVYITLIPKSDKDTARKEDHRLISLINIDINILSQIPTN